MIKAVAVDLDDTLCLSEAACFEVENETLRQMGRPPMPREIHKKTWGRLLAEAIQVRSPGVDAGEFMKRIAGNIGRAVAEDRFDTVSEAAYQALDQLIAAGKTVFILTSRTGPEMVHFLAEDHELASRITAFYYFENTRFHKPDPRVFDELLSENSLQPSECVYIGDSPTDAQAAKQAGLHFIASLESGLRSEQAFAGLRADGFVHRFSDVPAAVKKLASA